VAGYDLNMERFEPKWPDEPDDDGVYLPEDEDSRTLPPSTAPKEVFEIISKTYCPNPKPPKHILAEFMLFPKLPIELRRVIWRCSLLGRRVVEVLYENETGQCKSCCPIPTTLHVNSEARGVALESYELAFATPRANAMVYFDFSVDALFIGVGNVSPSRTDPASLLFRTLQYNDLRRLEHLIIDDKMYSLYPGVEEVEHGTDSDGGDDHEGFDNAVDSSVDNPESDASERSLNKLGLERLQSITIINNYGDNDLVLHETEDNKGEFHAWCISDDGKPVPWFIPESIELAALSHFSDLWRLTELVKWEGDTNLTTLRYVSRQRLRQEETWSKRISFLDQVVLPGGFNFCLYPKDGVIDRIMEMEEDENNTEPFDALHDYFDADPEYIYISQNPYVCPIGHRHQEPYHWPLEDYSLRRALTSIDPSYDHKLEDTPGAFPDEPLIGNDETSHLLQSSSREIIATTSPIRGINLESTSPVAKKLSLSTLVSALIFPLGSLSLPAKVVFFLWLGHLGHACYSGLVEFYLLLTLLYGSLAVLTRQLSQRPKTSSGKASLQRPPDVTGSPEQAPFIIRRAAFSVFEPLKKLTSYIKTSPAGQQRLERITPSDYTLTAVRQRAYEIYFLCMTLGTWLLLVLVGLTLAYSLLRFLVDLLSILMLLVAGLWLLAIWLMVHEVHNK
jgi:hypothetical protein